MALSAKLGSLLRQNAQLSMTSMVNSIRCMSASTTRLFVGGLSYETDDQSLREAFSNFGDVTDARVITDRESGRSRGFGFVNFASGESASSALSSMDRQELNGRNIRVSFANGRPSTPRFGGGNSGYGGYGRNSGY
ncbi:hypothetical protein SLEP1_g44213 [Rubroshorea leprosula]|uniref:RRM domain-containing protein n=1 Tax=Rubroshorea leprosula TaxID=152421 RepID=A0AAV5LFI4_9ROSI|nr:hypothetical protein SLEP1_g44213 [Rubroshorea leprosula]